MTDEQVGKWECKEKKRLCEEDKKFPDRKDNEILWYDVLTQEGQEFVLRGCPFYWCRRAAGEQEI